MLIENAIASIDHAADGWVRLDQVRKVDGGLELCFSIHRGRRGGKIDAWIVKCLGVHEANITALDGGGIAIYSSTHPAARQYVARQAELRWSGASDEAALLGALYQAHTSAVDDWIPFDWYASIETMGEDKFVCRGPDFLMRAYAKALRAGGKQPQVVLRGNRKLKAARPRVLHFGASHVVANIFTADHSGEQKRDRHARGLSASHPRTKGK